MEVWAQAWLYIHRGRRWGRAPGCSCRCGCLPPFSLTTRSQKRKDPTDEPAALKALPRKRNCHEQEMRVGTHTGSGSTVFVRLSRNSVCFRRKLRDGRWRKIDFDDVDSDSFLQGCEEDTVKAILTALHHD